MANPQALVIGSALPDSAFRLIAGGCFAASAVTALTTAALVAFATPILAAAPRAGLVAGFVLYAALTGWAYRRSADHSAALHAWLYAAAVGAMLLAGALAATLNDGLGSPALGILGVVICIITAVTGLRVGVVLAALAAVELAWLASFGPNGFLR